MKITKLLPLLFATLLLSAQAAFAKHYIAGAKRVTFRIGPGTENKIISMLEEDTAVTVLEEGEAWTKVKSDGNEGYVMNRFLTKEIPWSVKYKWLAGQHSKLKEELANLKAKEDELNQTLGEAKRELASTKENLENTSSEFQELKSGSAQYLELKAKYDETSKELAGSNKEVALLKEKLSLYYFSWFLAGAGILLLGWMIGYFSKKKKGRYGGGISL